MIKIRDTKAIDRLENHGYLYCRFKHFSLGRIYKKGAYWKGCHEVIKEYLYGIYLGIINLISLIITPINMIYIALPRLIIEKKITIDK